MATFVSTSPDLVRNLSRSETGPVRGPEFHLVRVSRPVHGPENQSGFSVPVRIWSGFSQCDSEHRTNSVPPDRIGPITER